MVLNIKSYKEKKKCDRKKANNMIDELKLFKKLFLCHQAHQFQFLKKQFAHSLFHFFVANMLVQNNDFCTK